MGRDAVAIVIGHHVVPRSNDSDYPFRQSSDLHYLTGFDHPSAVAIFRTDDGPPFTLFVQPRDRSAETWNGYRPGIEGAKSDYAADEAFAIESLLEEVPKQIEKAVRIYHTLGQNSDLDRTLIATLDSLRQRSKLGFEPASEIVDPRDNIHEMRLFK